MTDTKREALASPEKRAAALEIVLRRKADMPKNLLPSSLGMPTMLDYGERRPDGGSRMD